MSSHGKAQRRSLKECFKTLLHRRQDDQGHLTQVSCEPYGASNALTLLPSLASLSTLSGFNSSEYELRQYSVSILQDPTSVWISNLQANDSQVTIKPYNRSTLSLTSSNISDAYHFQSDIGDLAKACVFREETQPPSSRPTVPSSLVRLGSVSSIRSMSSRTTTSQAITPNSIHFQSPLSQLAHALDVPSMYRQGVSLQASLATISTHKQSISTLRSKESSRSLRSNRALRPVTPAVENPSLALVARPRICVTSEDDARPEKPVKRILQFQNVDSERALTPVPRPGAESRQDGGRINHFESFCVLDAATPGYPVTATSDDLKQVIELGEPFVLNTANIERPGMDIITGQDTKGEIVVHFIIYSPLVNPNNGRSRFVLASLLDITSFITGSTDVPDLEVLSEDSIVDEEEVRTPPGTRFHNRSAFNISTEDLIANAYIPEDIFKTPVQAPKDDIWLDLATEETRYSRSIKSSRGSTPRSRSSHSSQSSVNGVLDRFLETLQGLYSDFFLLGMSPLDESSFEIWNVSPSLNESRDYIDGYLAHISTTEKTYLDLMLTRNTSFVMRIKWGTAGITKLLHCIPLFGRSSVTWICFLVDEGKWAELPTWH